MLEQQDYQQLKQIVNEESRKVFQAEGKKLFDEEGKKLEDRIIIKVGEMINDNVLPILDELRADLYRLPDKSFISDRLIDLKGDTIVHQKKEDDKLNLLIKFLKDKKNLLKSEVEMLESFKIFPKQPRTVEEILAR